jgi:formate hydrogenlyase subunit 3/multisubunit Na+/H+ antiporter MnhD subunit
MNLIKEVLTELVSMFVGDSRLSLLVLAVIAAAAAICLSGLPPLAGGAALLLGSLAVLLDSVRRASRPRG